MTAVKNRRTAQEVAADYAQKSEAALRRAMFASHPHRAVARHAVKLLRDAADCELDQLTREAFLHAAAKVEHALSVCHLPEAQREKVNATPPLFDEK